MMLKNKVTMKRYAIILILFLELQLPGTVWAQQIGDRTSSFTIVYGEWKQYLQKSIPPEVIVRSSISSNVFYDNDPFRKIVALGVPSLPEVMDRVSEDKLLIEALSQITKWKYHVVRIGKSPESYTWKVEEFPQMCKQGEPLDRLEIWKYWWREGRFKTNERFAELYNRWKSLKSEQEDKKALEVYQEIADLGILALPYLIEQVEQEPEFILVISKLSDGSLPPTATAKECVQWWEKNRPKFELPSQSISQPKTLESGD